MSTILLTGATGMIGSALGKVLSQAGHRIIIVSRSQPEVAQSKVPFECLAIQTDLASRSISSEHLSKVEYVIHLAGESVASKRWSSEYKQKLVESRVHTTENLRKSFATLKSSALKGYIGASAIGYYPSSLIEEYNENSNAGSGFLSQLVKDWEAQHREWSFLSTKPKVTTVRIGVVHGYPGGVLGEVIPLFKSHLGSALGSGRQWMSWIDLEDLCHVFKWLLDRSQWSPIYNAVAPQPVTNQEWSQELASALNVGMLPNVPGFVLKTVLGERASILLDSQKVQPHKLLEEGFEFAYPTLRQSFDKLRKLFKDATHVFVAEQFVPRPINEVFSFFTHANNLEKISPPFLQFQVKSQSTPVITEGSIIDYRLKVRGVPTKWRSKILNWNPPYEFSDLQVIGPYKYWFHTHSFQTVPGGTLIRDCVRYKLPLSPLGDWVAQKYVRSEIQHIFNYRQKVIRQHICKE